MVERETLDPKPKTLNPRPHSSKVLQTCAFRPARVKNPNTRTFLAAHNEGRGYKA